MKYLQLVVSQSTIYQIISSYIPNTQTAPCDMSRHVDPKNTRQYFEYHISVKHVSTHDIKHLARGSHFRFE